MKRSNWIEIISSLFILLFIYTAVSKFIDFERFRWVLTSSPLIGEKSKFIVWLLPLLELFISFLLFFPKTRKTGLWGSFLLMILFTGYIGYMLFFSTVRPCACGGIIEKMNWNQHFLFNILFTLIAGLGLWLSRKQKKNEDITFQYSASL